jgi:hypothetical protein
VRDNLEASYKQLESSVIPCRSILGSGPRCLLVRVSMYTATITRQTDYAVALGGMCALVKDSSSHFVYIGGDLIEVFMVVSTASCTCIKYSTGTIPTLHSYD